MMQYSLSRLAQLLFMLLIASMVIFLVIQSAPGDPALVQLGLSATPEEVAVERQRLGLESSIPERYAIWLSQAAQLNLGRSFATGLPVTVEIGDALAYSFRLAVLAMLLGLSVGISLGIAAAVNRGKRIDLAVSAFAAGGLSLPSFASGTILILVVAVQFRLLPSAGAGPSEQSPLEAFRYLIMPAITLAIPSSAVLARFVRVMLIEVLQQDYMRTAVAKGLRDRIVVLRHGLRNAMIPTITVAGIQAGRLLGGAAITETVFSYPGLGYVTIQAVRGLNYPVVEGALLVSAAIFLVLTFLVDITYGLIDPRARVAG